MEQAILKHEMLYYFTAVIILNITRSTLIHLSHLGTVFIFTVQEGPTFYLINSTYLYCSVSNENP